MSRISATDYVGKTYGMLTIIGEGNSKRPRKWLCRCQCGEVKQVGHYDIVSGSTKSCGCLRRSRTIGLAHTHNCSHHGFKTPEYRSWEAMRARCNNPNNVGYHRYGGRGISVCSQWGAFENFLLDMGKRPQGTSLDRLDSNGNYCPENCRWATREQQANNTGRNVYPAAFGITMTVSQWSRLTNIPRGTLGQVMRQGRDFQEYLLSRGITEEKLRKEDIACQ